MSRLPSTRLVVVGLSPPTLSKTIALQYSFTLIVGPPVKSVPGSAGVTILSGTSSALSVGGSSRRGSGSKKSEGLRTARWVKRELLTRAPKTAEEIALDEKEVRSWFLVVLHHCVSFPGRVPVRWCLGIVPVEYSKYFHTDPLSRTRKNC